MMRSLAEDDDAPPKRSRALVAAIAATILLLALHLLQTTAVGLVLARARGELTHVALVLAGALSGVVFYAWAARGLLARRAAAARWAVRVDLVLAALGVVTLADEWQHFDRPWVDLSRMDPLAVTQLGFPAVMTVFYLAGAALTFAARADATED